MSAVDNVGPVVRACASNGTTREQQSSQTATVKRQCEVLQKWWSFETNKLDGDVCCGWPTVAMALLKARALSPLPDITDCRVDSSSLHKSSAQVFVLIDHKTWKSSPISRCATRNIRGDRAPEFICSSHILHCINMIRRGKTEGWLKLPQDAFLSWAMLNDVSFDRTVPGVIPGRGGALLAKEELDADEDMSNVLLTVPKDLILSLERVQEHAKTDKDFREVLESLGDFGRVGSHITIRTHQFICVLQPSVIRFKIDRVLIFSLTPR